MTRIDQFESVFRSADKTPFTYEPVTIGSILVVTDLEGAEAAAFGDRIRRFLAAALGPEQVSWRVVTGSEFSTVEQLLALVGEAKPDLICTYRTLHSGAWQWAYSLGRFLDVLTQATTTPVLVVPHPEDTDLSRPTLEDTDSVKVMTDHLTGDNRLINYAVRFTAPGGTLHLTHIEDEATFERFMRVIGKIPSIETASAREEILKQLLKEPHDYIASCREALTASGLNVQVKETVQLGHQLSDYKRQVDEEQVDLLVLNTKDEEQLAMHGLAYPLAVELRQVPLLLL